MDSNVFGNLILSHISVSYEGGLMQFAKDGGMISYVLFAKDSAILYVKDPSINFMYSIEQFNEKYNCQVKIVSDINFFGSNKDFIFKQLSEIAEDIGQQYNIENILINPSNPLILYVTIPDKVLSHEEIQEISSIFVSRIKTLVRGILIVNGESFPFSQEGVAEVIDLEDGQDEEVEDGIIPQTDNEDDTITQERIDELKDALDNIQTIDDLLKML